ncbi:hypothetical protein EDB89DRAFT_1911719 [Lactarius sanguifluus]|nr:hypothetical protein EDB89DRAFT_1911719 [Lactarius sanguifluus]
MARVPAGRDVNELSPNECTRECDSFVTSTRAREYSFPRVHASTSFHFGSREYSWYSRGHVTIFRVGKDLFYYTESKYNTTVLLPLSEPIAGVSRRSVIGSSWSSPWSSLLLAIAPLSQVDGRFPVVVIDWWWSTGIAQSSWSMGNGHWPVVVPSPSSPRPIAVAGVVVVAAAGHPNDDYDTAGRGSNDDDAPTTVQNDSKARSNNNNNAIDINDERRQDGKASSNDDDDAIGSSSGTAITRQATATRMR